MKHYLMLLTFISLVLASVSTSCQKDSNKSIEDFIIKDYNPDIIINENDTVLFDIDQNGINDFKAFHKNASGFTYLTFESLNVDCVLSDGTSHPNRKYILHGDSVNEDLTWDTSIIWVVGIDDTENGNAYLGVKLMTVSDLNFGWLLPTVEGTNSSNHYLVIDKTAYCKTKNTEILAGQESDTK